MYPNKQRDIEMLKSLKKKKFIDAKMAGYITDKITEVMPNLKDVLDKYDIRPKDMIRFQVVSRMCLSQREKKGLNLKQIALSLKVPQYRLKYIESSSVKHISTDILESYIDHLELREWFNSWKKHNMDVYNT
jgi:ribosomal protein S17E